MAKIFVNYRRDDVPGDARGVRDGLAAKFGKSNVFMDVDNLLVGQRFDIELAKALDACDTLIAVIGPRWMDLLKERNAKGERDYVREEIAAALARKITVIPVRVGREGSMPPLPRPDELPEDIRDLVLYQKLDVAHERFGRDMADLIEGIVAVRKALAAGQRPGQSQSPPWGLIGAGVVGALAISYVAAAQLGVPVWAPWQGAPPGRVSTGSDPQGATSAKAASDPAANSAELERLRTAAAKAEDDRKRIEAEAAKLRTAAETERNASDAELKARAAELERLRSAATKSEEDRKRIEAETAALRADAEARRKAEEKARADAEAERQRLAMLAAEEEKKRKDAEARQKAEEAARKAAVPQPGDTFRDCEDVCPEMVVVPAGSFMMGHGKGQTKKTISHRFAVGKFEVTFAEWDACVREGGCRHKPGDEGWGRGNRPVINVSWEDATNEYLPWLSKKTGKTYRLLSEAQWEYAARAGTTTGYFWGDEIGKDDANCNGCGSQWDNKQTAPVGSFKPNAFGLYDMHGNAWEWVEDKYKFNESKNYSIQLSYQPRRARGGGWQGHPVTLHSANRTNNPLRPDSRNGSSGFRVSRSL